MKNSVRSHYSASDVGQLMGVSARSAQSYIELLPREAIGQAYHVKREDLCAFLEKVSTANDHGGERKVREFLEEIRKAPAPITRKKIRSLVRCDADAIEASSLPQNLELRRGRLVVDWRRPEELAEAMVFIAKIIETPEFDRDYCVARPSDTSHVVDAAMLDKNYFAAEISRLERAAAARFASEVGHHDGHHVSDRVKSLINKGR